LQNLNQTPSYEYPKRYGKMPPLFSRATKIKMNGHTILFISGTASIKNHESQFKGDIKKQFDLTVHNLRKIMKISKLKWDKERVKLIIYLRDKNNLNKIKGLISKIDGKNSSFMLANICRKDLDIEIEGWFGDI
jgi:chorismate lyase/3-hydroxybenzoate synthase